MMREFPRSSFKSAFRDNPSRDDVIGRDEVRRISETSIDKALARARQIQHPWYRCQAIASIVEVNPAMHGAKDLLCEALNAAYSQSEPNRVASVASWPLALLVGAYPEFALMHTRRLLGVIAKEPHGLRRLHGLAGIFRAVIPDEALREVVLAPFLETARISFGWRTERTIGGMVQILARYDREAAEKLLASCRPGKFAEKARQAIRKRDAST